MNPLQPTRNFDYSSSLVVHNYGPKSALFRFDLSSLGGTAVADANLRLPIAALKTDGTIDLHIIEEDWAESTVNGGNQPAHSDTGINIPVSTADVGDTVAVDVTALVQNWFDGTTANFGFRLQTEDDIKAELPSLSGTETPVHLVVSMFAGATNTAPELTSIGPQATAEMASLNIGLNAQDANGDDLTFSATGLPEFAALTNTGTNTGTIAVNPGPNDSGSYEITVNVG